ncbi:MAG: zinc ribbon domain-containing protein [Candidatus Wallbacteria bacterium]|nr:zinc ribbon domain-containing protein [Candidatus Wallbacteria bacterium]
MPIYEYSCESCHTPFELLVPITQADTLPPCPSCASTDTRKLLSLFSRASSSKGAGDSTGTSAEPSKTPGPGGHCGPGSCGCGRF